MIQTKARPHPRGQTGAAFPAILRPSGVPHATDPVSIPQPEHHHLPAWVRRAFAKAGPILGDLAGSLEGETREQYMSSITELTANINSGKFSQAFQYPTLIETGLSLYEQQRKEQEESARARKVLENARRSVGETLRDAAAQLTPEASSRLNKALRTASDQEAISAVEAEARQALDSAKVGQERRREREISRTRSRIARATPKYAAVDGAETWQDVLRRLQEQMAQESAENGGNGENGA